MVLIQNHKVWKLLIVCFLAVLCILFYSDAVDAGDPPHQYLKLIPYTYNIDIINYSKFDVKITKNTTESGPLNPPRTIKAWSTYSDYDLKDRPDGFVYFSFPRHKYNSSCLWFWTNRDGAFINFLPWDSGFFNKDGDWIHGRYSTNKKIRGQRWLQTWVSVSYTITLYLNDCHTLTMVIMDTNPGYKFKLQKLDYSHGA
jgi:hypothetical protein